MLHHHHDLSTFLLFIVMKQSLWDKLPRDLLLYIIKYFDMDTRIKLGLIFKLRIPNHVKEKLNKLQKPYECKFYNVVILGRRTCAHDGTLHSIYTLYYYKYERPDSQWHVDHIVGYGNFYVHALQDGKWKLT